LQQAAEEERRAKAAAEAEQQNAAQLAAQQAAKEERKAKATEAERHKAALVATCSDKISMVEKSAPEKSLSTSEMMHSAQIELTRLGCFSGDPDGTLNPPIPVNRYLSRRGHRDSQTTITDSFVSELRSQQARVCPPDCPAG
jgi:hypothetical protein